MRSDSDSFADGLVLGILLSAILVVITGCVWSNVIAPNARITVEIPK